MVIDAASPGPINGKRVIILSDNAKLSRAIELKLQCYPGLEIVKLVPGQRRSPVEIGDCDLIVVAMSSSSSEPLVALAKVSLTGRIGQVPVLVISDRPFRADPDTRIAHLDFPFDIDKLPHKVRELLEGQPSPGPETVACSGTAAP
jgi:hypothetical protein